MMMRVMPYAAIQFAAFEQFKILLEVDRNGVSTPIRRFLSGTLAAMSSTCLTYPLDVARTRFATNHTYHTLRAAFVEEYRKAGLGGFYRGFVPTIMGMIPYAGMSFFTYTTLKLHYKECTGRPTGPMENFIFGGFSGIVGQTTSYPFDIVRRRMQTDKLPQDLGVFKALLQIARSEGFIGGWYKGLSMNWIKGPISTGIVFSTYDMIFAFTKDLLHRR